MLTSCAVGINILSKSFLESDSSLIRARVYVFSRWKDDVRSGGHGTLYELKEFVTESDETTQVCESTADGP